MIEFTNLVPDRLLRSKLDDAYNRVMSSGVYVRGKEVTAFEQEWAEYCQAKYCVSCGCGLDALQLCLRQLQIGRNDWVIVPRWTAASTWVAVGTVNALLEPKGVWPEVDRKAVCEIVVHLYGQRCPVTETDRLIIHDCAQAHGLKVDGLCCWSFYPTKNLGAYGDGGAITTNYFEVAERLKMYRNHGSIDAINSRLDPLQAAFLRVKLKYLNRWIARRRENAEVYMAGLRDVPGITLPTYDPYDPPVWHQFVIRVQQRYCLRRFLTRQGIETMIHYPQAPHQALGYHYKQLSDAEELARTVVSLPVAPHVTVEQVEHVVNTIKRWRSIADVPVGHNATVF